MKYRSHLAMVKTRLTPIQFDVLHSEMYRLGRQTLTAYALWGLLGWAGVHQLYLGRRWKGLSYLGLVLLGVCALTASFYVPEAFEEPYVMVLQGASVAAGMIFLFLMTVDLFSLHRQVDLCNERLEDQIIMALAEQVPPPVTEERVGRASARPLYFE